MSWHGRTFKGSGRTEHRAQIEPYLVAQLQAYKSGARKNDAMSVIAPSLSDTDIEDLAAYFSAIEINVVKLPGG